MILSDREIRSILSEGNLIITPQVDEHQIQPASIDLRLSNEYLQPRIGEDIDMKVRTPNYEFIRTNRLLLPPHHFILATTKEKIEMPKNLVGRVEGRSSIGRMGLTIHITAGYIDPGFRGQITLELANISNNTIVLYENMRICQLVLEELSSSPQRPYGEAYNKYQDQVGVTGSYLHYDDESGVWGV